MYRMAWVGQNNIRNYKYFKVKIGETFNIEARGGPGRFNKPLFIYGFTHLESLDFRKSWNGICELTGNYPNYILNLKYTDNNINTNTSEVSVLVFENESEPIIQDSSPKNGVWTTVATIGRIEIFDISDREGYTFDLDLMFGVGTFSKDNCVIFTLPKDIKFGTHASGYNITPQHVSGNRYKINLSTRSVNIQPKITRYKGSQGSTTHNLDKDCLNFTFTMGTITSPNDTHVDKVNIQAYLDGEHIFSREDTYGSAFGGYGGWIDGVGKRSLYATWKASSRFDYNELVVVENIAPMSQNIKATVTCIVIGGV